MAKTPTRIHCRPHFLCDGSHRANCVVDGVNGQKIRIADIDKPELSPRRCEAERIKGEAAKNAGARHRKR
ncbi:endonuclease YncB(thermonuclease family) [Rhizobium leguminosarum]